MAAADLECIPFANAEDLWQGQFLTFGWHCMGANDCIHACVNLFQGASYVSAGSSWRHREFGILNACLFSNADR